MAVRNAGLSDAQGGDSTGALNADISFGALYGKS